MGLIGADVPFPLVVLAACIAAGAVAGLLLTVGPPEPPRPLPGRTRPGRTTPSPDPSQGMPVEWDTGGRSAHASEGQHIVDPAHPHLRRPGPAHRRR